ncbi:MAG TPA: hypothetical protein VH142_24455 [Polyangiaceae bacterium]|jgi:hypothetical protein|nr:hypothetical protein [Polyangiaceae bacterium]
MERAMASDDPDDGSLFSRALRETLDTVVAPVVRDALIHDALVLSGLERLPADRATLYRFARNELRHVTERALGVELAETIAEEILRVTQAIPSRFPPPAAPASQHAASTRPRSSTPALRRTPTPGIVTRRTAPFGTPAARSTPPHATQPPATGPRRSTPLSLRSWRSDGSAPAETAESEPDSQVRPQGETAAVVLLASDDREIAESFARLFGARATVKIVAGTLDFVRHLDHAVDRRLVVLLDGKGPSIRPSVLAVLLEDMPQVHVIVFRAASATMEVPLSSSPTSSRWIVYGEPASLERVAEECLELALPGRLP